MGMQVIIGGLFKKITNCYAFVSFKRNVDLKWSDKCDRTFTDLKKLVSKAPVLRGPNWELHFDISTNASDATIGVVLSQEEDVKPYATYYISRNLITAELNYTVT